MPNIERLKTLLEYVEKLPEEAIEMETYFCGTAACLLGHATSVFPETFKTAKGMNGKMVIEFDNRESFCPGVKFFDLTTEQWESIFEYFIPNDKAVQNLRDHIERWSNAQH